jgi:hypothetical protein
MIRRVVCAVTAVGAVACGGAARRATLSVDDYAAYRRFRTAPTLEQKLARSYDYLRTNREGGYHAEVSRWLSLAAARYVDRAWEDPARLDAFLALVPSGPFARRAAERAVELKLSEEYRRRGDRAFDERVARLEQRLAVAEAGRRELIGGIASWARRLAGIRTWGGRTSELDSDLIYAYRLAEPAARCDDDTCTKTLNVTYDVPEGKVQSERQAIYDVVLRLTKGGVSAAWITGPELFTRLGEAVRVAAIAPADMVGRAEAIGQAAQMLALAVEPVLPAAHCTSEAVSPVVLRRVCDGVELRVISALEPSEEDRVVIEPLPARNGGGPSRSDTERAPDDAGP